MKRVSPPSATDQTIGPPGSRRRDARHKFRIDVRLAITMAMAESARVRHVVRSNRAPMGAIVVALALGCGGSPSTPDSPGDSTVRFIVMNDLAPPVTVAIDGVVSLILSSGSSSGLAVSPAAQWLTWTSAKATDTTGTPIPDDIGQVQVRVTGIRNTLEITNVIDDTTYVTASIFNETSARVWIGVYEGTTVSCVSVLPGAAAGVDGFTRIGYYRLLPATQVRAYREVGCTGPSFTWTASDLSAFLPKSGLVALTLHAAP